MPLTPSPGHTNQKGCKQFELFTNQLLFFMHGANHFCHRIIIVKITSGTRWWKLLLVLAASSLVLYGCAASGVDQDNLQASDEEAYIDLKHSFTLVVPTSWELVKIPVFSPNYRSDSVNWRILSSGTKYGTLQIRVSPATTAPLRQQFLAFLNGDFHSGSDKIEKFDHPAGKALRVDTDKDGMHLIRLAIAGKKRIFFLFFRLAPAEVQSLRPSIEKTIRSFAILHD